MHRWSPGTRVEAILENVTDIVGVFAADGTVRYLTPSIRDLTGLDDDRHLVGSQLWPSIHPEDRADVIDAFSAWRRARGPTEAVSCRITHTDGGWRHVDAVGINRLDDPDIRGIVVTFRDRTERRQAERQLAHSALHDSLTGIPNRALFEDRLSVALTRLRNQNEEVAVLVLDIDRMKFINEAIGHDAGDALLIEVAAAISAIIPVGATAARISGDEFAVLFTSHAGMSATALAGDITTQLSQRYRIDGREIHVTVSTGIATAGAGVIPDAGELLRGATAAVYRAKSRGGGRYEVASHELARETGARLDLESQMRDALCDGQYRVVFQPEVELGSGDVVGLEALVRWEHPERGMLAPAEFIDLAEANGVIVPLGAWVLEEACRQMAVLDDLTTTGHPLRLAVNVSARQLSDPTLFESVAIALDRTGFDPGRLWLEITETALMADVDDAASTLARLRELGVHFAIDDFGTGWSSLTYLKRFPIELLKIDRSFVRGLGADPDDSAIVAAIVDLAHALGLQAIAEGVESQDQVDALSVLDCDLGQGYHWNPPMCLDEIVSWLERPHPEPVGRILRHRRGEREPLPPADRVTQNTLRRLVSASCAYEVVGAVLDAVRDLGGAVMPASVAPADAMPVDLAIGVGDPVLLVAADAATDGVLRRMLPVLVSDAHMALDRLGSSPEARLAGAELTA